MHLASIWSDNGAASRGLLCFEAFADVGDRIFGMIDERINEWRSSLAIFTTGTLLSKMLYFVIS